MDNKIPFYVVENRSNDCIDICIESAKKSKINLTKIESITSSDFDVFSKKYIHRSTNSKHFELICFRRYFVLLDFLKKTEVDKFVLIDSDIILCAGIDEYIYKNYGKFDFAGSALDFDIESNCQISPHVSLWTVNSLSEFVEFLLNAYSDKKTIERLDEINNYFVSNKRLGGVSDMTLIYLWAKETNRYNLINEINEDSVVDHNISVVDNIIKDEFASKAGIKKIVFKNGSCFFVNDNKEVKIYAAHFQGRAKILMKHFFNRNYVVFFILSYFLTFARTMKKIKYKLIKSN